MSTLGNSYDQNRVRGTDAWLTGSSIKIQGIEFYERGLGELARFIRYAKEAKGPVLELASGACRVMGPLAVSGIDVYGLESSRPMIEAGIKRVISKLPIEAQRRIKIVQGDMFNFYFLEKFPLIIIPFVTFWYNCRGIVENECRKSPVRDEEFRLRLANYAERCIYCMVENLRRPGGRFLIDGPYWGPGEDVGDDFFKNMSLRYDFRYNIETLESGISREILIGTLI